MKWGPFKCLGKPATKNSMTINYRRRPAFQPFAMHSTHWYLNKSFAQLLFQSLPNPSQAWVCNSLFVGLPTSTFRPLATHPKCPGQECLKPSQNFAMKLLSILSLLAARRHFKTLLLPIWFNPTVWLGFCTRLWASVPCVTVPCHGST